MQLHCILANKTLRFLNNDNSKVFFVGWQLLNLEMNFRTFQWQSNQNQKSFYLGVEATDLDSWLSVCQPQKRDKFLRTGLEGPLNSWLTPVNHSVQCCFYLTCSKTEGEKNMVHKERKIRKKCQGPNLNVERFVPICVQQWECFLSRWIQRDGEATHFTDRHPALHHIVCSRDSKSSEAQQKDEVITALLNSGGWAFSSARKNILYI